MRSSLNHTPKAAVPAPVPIALALAFATIPTLAHANDRSAFEDTNGIDAAIATHLGVPIGAAGGAQYRVDPNLRLQKCREAISMQTMGGVNLNVSCAAPEWRLRVPIVGRAPTNARAPIGQSQTPHYVVMPNKTYTLRIIGNGFSMQTDAIAMEKGAVGDRVKIKVGTKNALLEAVVDESGQLIIVQ